MGIAVKEKLQEYALFAEIVSAIGIIVSLIFVGFQIQGNTVASEAATYQASVGYDIDMLMRLAEDEELSRIVNAYVYGEEKNLNDNELIRAEYQMTALLRHLENLFLQHDLQLLSDESWKTRESFLKAIILSPGYEKFQSSLNAKNFSGSFINYANKLRAGNDQQH